MSRFTFFRQSGWMLIASVAGGAFMFVVHPILVKHVDELPLGKAAALLNRVIRQPISDSDYGLFTALLSMLALMSIFVNGMQGVFAQQTAAAVDETHERQLRRTVRVVFGVTALIWFLAVLVIFAFRRQVLANFQIAHPAALWVTLLTCLPILWSPILGGILQGRQNFLWLGWTSILSGVGRCLGVFVIVRLLGAGVTGAMLAALIGAVAALLVSVWQTYPDLIGPSESMQWRPWASRVIPLTLGLGATTFMMSLDTLVVRSLFPPEQTGFYGAAGVIGRALVLFTAPLAFVMFPKIVRSAAMAERTDVMAQALGATALLGIGAALFCTIFPSLPLRIVYANSYLVITPLVPWFVWCMLPLTLANVLINNLLARQKFAIVPWLVIVTLSYATALLLVATRLLYRDQLAAFKSIVQVLGSFSLILFVVSVYFTWARKHRSP